jgi:uncharacterized protein (TIGR04255 family)
MKNKWENLANPPVIMAIFQIKFTSQKSNFLSDLVKNDTKIKKQFPLRKENVHANIDMPSTIALGISTIKGKADTKINSYIYFSENQKKKLMIEENSVTFVSEEKYFGWNVFKNEAINTLNNFINDLQTTNIERISIRFINKFSFDNFDNPLDYFNTQISTSSDNAMRYPVSNYAFKYTITVPEQNIYAIVNQSLQPSNTNKKEYILDIDVLDNSNLIFNINSINQCLEELREVKNTIFFENITQQTIDLCN